MGNPDHLAWLKEGVNAWNARRQRHSFKPDLRSESISNALGAEERDFIHDTRRANARGINLSGANLIQATLNNLDFTGANFVQSDLSESSLVNSVFTGAMFVGSRLRNARPHSANFQGAKFLSSEFDAAQFVGADLGEAQLWRCSLVKTHLYNANLIGTDFLQSRPWMADLFLPQERFDVDSSPFNRTNITGIEDLLSSCREFRQLHGDDVVLYFRGQSNSSWELRPSVMRQGQDGQAALRPVEGDMLNDLVTRQPEPFSQQGSAIAQWVFAQHHGLRTRLLDVTRNPLVGLYYACEGHHNLDGQLHVFAVPNSLIKPFNSDTVSIIANFAKLSRREQNMLLGKTKEDASDDVFPAMRTIFSDGWRRNSPGPKADSIRISAGNARISREESTYETSIESSWWNLKECLKESGRNLEPSFFQLSMNDSTAVRSSAGTNAPRYTPISL